MFEQISEIPVPSSSPQLQTQFFAWIIDMALLFIGYYLLQSLWILLPSEIAKLVITLFFLCVPGYFVLCWTKLSHQTIGEKLFDLQVITITQQPISIKQAFIRSVLMTLYFAIIFPRGIILGKNFWQITTPQWHDVISKTSVVQLSILHEQKRRFLTIFYTTLFILVGILLFLIIFS